MVLANLLERFKEKKATMVAAVNTTCDAMIQPTTLGEALELLEPAWQHKVPGVRAGALGWTSRLILKTPKNNMIKQAKSIAEAMEKPMADKVQNRCTCGGLSYCAGSRCQERGH